MACTVIVGHNPLDRKSWSRHENVSDFGKFLLEDFAPLYNGHFPSSGRIYLESIDNEHDITPATRIAAEALRKIDGTVYVMVWPKEPIATSIVVNLAIVIVATAVKEFLKQKQHPAEQRRQIKGSPNNVPGLRRNSSRIEERIPDIYGRVRATPDLIGVPYITYTDNLQQETSIMCVGQGEYTIFEAEVFEGDTQVRQLQDTSVEIYGPGELPGGGTPTLTIGDPISEGLFNVIAIDNVKGDLLSAPNQNALYNDDVFLWGKDGDLKNNVVAVPASALGMANTPIEYSYPSAGVGRVRITCGNSGFYESRTIFGVEADFITSRFGVGTAFGIEWSTSGITIHPRNLTDGTGTAPNLKLLPETIDDDHYVVTSVTVTSNPSPTFDIVEIDFTVPVSVQAEWALIATYNPTGGGSFGSTTLPAETVYNFSSILYPISRRVGPFFVNDPNMEFFRLNFVAEQGLWVDDGTKQRALKDGVTITVEVTPADENGDPDGATETFECVLNGSSSSRDFIGQTFDITPTVPGRSLIAAYRTTLTPNRHQSNGWETYNRAWTLGPLVRLTPWDGVTPSEQFKGDFADEVKWAHAYSMSAVTSTSFGNVTVVHARVNQRRNQAPSDIDRRLNMIVNRNISVWDGTELTPTLFPVRNARDIIFDILKQRHLGNLDDANIDFTGISATYDAVLAEMGTEAVTFDHTFDSDNASLEDLLASVGNSCFMSLYRQGNIVKAAGDVSTENATVLFNHRNKLPGTETRSVTFNTEEEYDGVQISYFNDTDERIETFVLPGAGLARNPRILDIAGIHQRAKAMTHAWRAYNQLQYQNTFVEFEACEEALLSIFNDKILVADNTRTDVQDGDIIDVDGLEIRTSQQLSIGVVASTIFVQHIDGTTEAIPIASQDTNTTLTLATAPSQAILVDYTNDLYPRYFITRNTTTTTSTYRVLNRQYSSPGVFKVTASNYTEAYYFFDAITLWLIFENTLGYNVLGPFDDRSPLETICTQVASATTVFDNERQKLVYSGSTALDRIDCGVRIMQSYTIATWLNKTDSATSAILFESFADPDIDVIVDATTNRLVVDHDNIEYVESIIDVGEWVHIAITYNHLTEDMALYVNGELVDSATAVPATSLTIDVTVLRSLIGKADDFRLYNKSKSPDFIRTLYHKTRVF